MNKIKLAIKENINFIFCLFFVFILFLLLTVFFVKSNKGGDLIISHKSGFYDNPFYLDIKPTNKNLKIYYTLDCTRPTPKSTEYKEPILIKDATPNKNVYSARKDMSAIFMLQEKGLVKNKLKIPNEPVDKAVILKVGLYDNEKLIKEDIRVFFVGFDKKKGYKGLPVVSLVLEPDDLLDYEKGIYVLGKNFIENPKDIDNKRLTAMDYGGNFYQRGENWVRDVNINVFNEFHKIIFSDIGKTSIHGNSSRMYVFKNLNLYSSLNKNFKFTLMNKFFNTKKIVLYYFGNDYILKVKDYLIQSFEKESQSNISTLQMCPCIMFLNGEYWGVYYISETFNSDYFKNYYGLSKNNYSISKKEEIKNKIEKKDFYNEYKNNIDIDSFIDYFTTEIYVANKDWSIDNNVSTWKSINVNTYQDSKAHYILYDLNFNKILFDYEDNTFDFFIKSSDLFRLLFKNKEFREKLRKRMYQLENEIYTSDKVNKFIDEYAKLMKEPLEKNNYTYYYTKNYDKIFNRDLGRIKTFIEKRPEYINKYMEECFKEYE